MTTHTLTAYWEARRNASRNALEDVTAIHGADCPAARSLTTQHKLITEFLQTLAQEVHAHGTPNQQQPAHQ